MQTRVAASNIHDTAITGIQALIIPILQYCKNVWYPGIPVNGISVLRSIAASEVTAEGAPHVFVSAAAALHKPTSSADVLQLGYR